MLKPEPLMLPESPCLSLERMRCDAGGEVSKESLVFRKPLSFHASYSKGFWGSFSPDGQMNVHCSASFEGVSLVKWLQEASSPSPAVCRQGCALPEQLPGKR